MKQIIKRHTISIKNALSGIIWAFSTQPNYWVHSGLAGISLILGYYLQIKYEEWLVLLILITIGFVFETINTAIEATCDAISLEKREAIRIAKDVSAGAMLIFALGSIIIAGVIFLPRIF